MGQTPRAHVDNSSGLGSDERLVPPLPQGGGGGEGEERAGYNAWLYRFALLTTVCTLFLIIIGGLVTSHGAGMAVPDWPNSYGYNMFAFPISKWIGGILYEHSHRLMASLVGLLTSVLAIWLWIRDTQGRERWLGVGAIALVLGFMGLRVLPVYVTLACLAFISGGFTLYKLKDDFCALRWWGILAFSAVILQGVLGGLRVVWLKDQIGIFHATLAQLFFALTCLIALLTSRWASERTALFGRPITAPHSTFPLPLPKGEGWGEEEETVRKQNGLRKTCDAKESCAPTQNIFVWLLPVTTLLILTQLILGATMRHQHAGLAIPDFPLAYGKLWPSMDPASVIKYNQQRQELTALNPITAAQIGLQMAHRVIALLICVAVAFCAWTARRRLGAACLVSKLTSAWIALVLLQALLGAATIWTGKAADVATAHVMMGALVLAIGLILSIVVSRDPASARVPAPKPESLNPFGLCPSAAHTVLK